MTQNSARHIRFRGRSFPVLALEPEMPLSGWIDRLDDYLACSPAFFSKKAIVIDVSQLGIADTLAASDASLGSINLKETSTSEPICIAPLVVDAPVRSDQTIFHPQGDVVVVGSVSSGADVIAGGSIHIYGTLRGRAMAGAYGEKGSRIFCRRLEAELLAVGGVYQTADEIDKKMHGQNVQVWLEKEDVRITRLD